ncbi:MAG: hypothetical protein ACUVTG_09235 [Candidatus Oleimicrobiaceae bacterium]
MRIDFVVDSFSSSDQVGPTPSPKGERFTTYSRSGLQAEPEPPAPKGDQVKLSGEVPPLPPQPPKEESESVLDLAEREMLGRLFPPGLFGNGVRAYRLAQGREEAPLGQHIDTRS